MSRYIKLQQSYSHSCYVELCYGDSNITVISFM